MENFQLEIELNHYKILKMVWKSIYSKQTVIFWLILSLIYPIILVLSFFSDNIILIPINYLSFIFPGVTGLSFSVTLLNATRNLFDIESLKAIYLYTDDNNPQKGFLFYRTIAPYIVSSYIWLLISLLALFSSIFTVTFPIILNGILQSLFFSLLIAGFISLWWLVSVHISDVTVEIQRLLNKK